MSELADKVVADWEKSETLHTFKPNDLVLKKTPGLCSSLETSLEGRISDVTYSIVPTEGKKSKSKAYQSVEEVCSLISLS